VISLQTFFQKEYQIPFIFIIQTVRPMSFYKVIYANSTVISCKEVKQLVPVDKETFYRSEDNSKMISAYIKADSSEEATAKAMKLINEVVMAN
jgi:hypothetical protein